WEDLGEVALVRLHDVDLPHVGLHLPVTLLGLLKPLGRVGFQDLRGVIGRDPEDNPEGSPSEGVLFKANGVDFLAHAIPCSWHGFRYGFSTRVEGFRRQGTGSGASSNVS